MPRQEYNIINQIDKIQITKNESVVYEVSVKAKSINLAELYNNMKVDIMDEYILTPDLIKIEFPQNDSERIFNNIFDFIGTLLESLNKKLIELKEKQTGETFE